MHESYPSTGEKSNLTSSPVANYLSKELFWGRRVTIDLVGLGWIYLDLRYSIYDLRAAFWGGELSVTVRCNHSYYVDLGKSIKSGLTCLDLVLPDWIFGLLNHSSMEVQGRKLKSRVRRPAEVQ